VLVGELPKALKEDAEMYAGCVAGAIQKDEYIGYIHNQGFENITLQKQKPITIPDDILGRYLSEEEILAFNEDGTGIYSITVFAQKPGSDEKADDSAQQKQKETITNGPACTPGSGCC